MEPEDIEPMVGIMIFHAQALATLARQLAEHVPNKERMLIEALLEKSGEEAGTVTEHALWETVKDMFNPEIERSLPKNVVELRKDH